MGYSWGACKRTFTVDVMRRQSASFVRGGGGTPLYKPYRYVPSHKQYGFWFLVFFFWFLRRFRLKTLPILVWNRVWFRGNYGSVWRYLSFQFQMSEKEREICGFEMEFKKSFLLLF